MHYWKKTRPNMKMAADLKAMNRPRAVVVDIPTRDADGVIVSVRQERHVAHARRADLHRLAMGGGR